MTRSRDIADSTKTLDVDGGTIKLDGNYPVGTANVALGNNALSSATSANDSIAVGDNALLNNTSGSDNTAVGTSAMKENTTGSNNSAYGVLALDDNTTGASNVGVGHGALRFNTTASDNTAVGYATLYSNTTGTDNNALGKNALYSNTTGSDNTAMGDGAGYFNTTGSFNTALGFRALRSNTTASSNTAVGYQAGYSNTTGGRLTAFGYQAGYNCTATGTIQNAFFGNEAGHGNTSGTNNTYIGGSSATQMTTGSFNTIIGAYNGNQGGLDIRTSSNNIVLSDGDGNPRMNVDSSGNIRLANTAMLIDNSGNTQNGLSVANTGTTHIASSGANTTLLIQNINTTGSRIAVFFLYGSTGVGSITVNGSATAYNTSSDYRLKENVDYTWDATTRLKQLKPARFNFIADADTTVDGFLAHEAQAVVPEAVTGTHNEVDADGNPEYQGIDQSKLVPLLVKTIQELEARITALEA